MSAPKVFTYDSARINYFFTDTYGEISGSAGNLEDFGNISDAAIDEEDALGFNPNDYGLIVYTGVVYPFGSIADIQSGGEEAATFVPAVPVDTYVIQGAGKVSRTQAPWQGSGTLFEIGGGLERLVIPDLGAAGPSPTLSGEAVTSNTFTEVGSGTLTVSEEAATAEFNIYPFESRITLTVSGGTSQEYPDEYIEVRPNEETLNGTLDESRTYDYSFYTGGFEEFDFGTVAVRQGAGFSDTDGVTFDSTDTNVNSFADADQVTAEAFGEISQTPASYEDWGQIVADVRYGKLSTKATSVNAQNKAYDKFIRDYVGETAQLVKQSGLSERNTFAWEGSGTITAQGQLGLGQAPQHTVFGEEGQFTFNGSAEESFTPKGIEGTGLIVKGSAATESVTRERISRAELFFTGFAEGLKLTHFPPTTGPTYTLSGAASDIAFVSDYDGAELFVVSGTIIEDFTPHWRSPLQRDGIVTPVDYGSITQTPIPEDIDYGFVRLVAFRAEDYKYIIPGFKSVEILGESTEAYSRSSYLGIGTYFLSDFADAPRAYDYESSGITGIATYKAGINIFGANWFSQAPQHTVFGLEGSFTIQGSGAESITPTTEIGSGSLFTIGGISETTAVNPPAAGTKFISGSAKVNPVPAPKGSGTITISQGREEGQTYLRIIDVGTTFGLFGITGSSIEKNTEHYNRSSIKYGQENENFGQIFGTDPSFGFDLQYKGIQSSSVEDYSEGTLTFDNSDQIGRTYDEAVGGAGVLPTFDKTNQYNVNFSSTVVSEDWGEIEDNANTVGGPSYDQELYPYNTGFIDQRGIDAGYFDYGWINEDTQDPPKVPFEPPARIIDAVPRAKTMWIPSFPGSGTVLFDISSATESITVFERADVPLLPLSGSGDEAVVWQSPERTVTILTSGTATESLTKVDVGIGTLATITGELVERVRFEEVGSGTISLVGIATEKLISNPPEGTSLFTPYGSYSNFSAAYSEVADKAVLRLSGELVHPDIDYTPHYGIDRNIGIETGFTLSSGGGLNEDGTGPGIVTTRFIPDYPAAGTIFIEGKAIGRTNAPILTDGTIYILGIGTEAMVLSMMTLELVTSMVSSLVRRNASFLQLSKRVLDSSTLLELHQTDQSVSLDTMETTEIQAHLVRSRSLQRQIKLSTAKLPELQFRLVLVHSLELSISEKPMLTMVLVLSTQSVELQKALWFVQLEQVHCSYLVLMVLQRHTPHKLQRMLLPSHFLEMLKKLSLLPTNTLVLFTHLERHIQPEQDLMLHLVLSSPSRVVQNPSHLLSPPSQFLSALVANLQTDQFRSLDTTETTEIQAHLEQFRLLGNLPIQTSTLLQQSKVQVYSTSLENLLLFTESPQLSLVVLQHYLVLQTYRLPRAQANRHNSSELLGMEKLLSTLYMVTMETTRILVHLVRQQFLVLAIPEKSKYSDITETTEILELQENFNFLPRLLFIHLSITLHLQMVLVYSRLLAVSEFAVFSHQYRRLDPSSVSDRETRPMQDLPTSVSEISQSRRSHQQSSNVYNLKKVAHSLLSFNSIIFKSINKTEAKSVS